MKRTSFLFVLYAMAFSVTLAAPARVLWKNAGFLSLPGQAEARSPKWSKLRGDPGPPAAAVPPPAGYPVGPGMGPIGAGSPNAGPGSPVGADGAR